MYKIERDVIWIFNEDNTNKFLVGPFAFDITDASFEDAEDYEDDGD